ncbi:DNA excision repair protein ERCC-6 [Hamiltosporidium magnivora]|uniref:DNA excision repair protein ERCC-6 n=1 Tax=Hamiltosporidium magnivora TaxID=148818 RepID=A0A4Q9LK39_9MICR|nr:DNA excision repair protein ERCC-6 [Hamiltosporidium magnivora]
MNKEEDVEKYEKEILKKVIEDKTKKKIEKINEEIKQCIKENDTKKIDKLNQKKEKIERNYESEKLLFSDEDFEKNTFSNYEEIKPFSKHYECDNDLEKFIKERNIKIKEIYGEETEKIEDFYNFLKTQSHKLEFLYIYNPIWNIIFSYQKECLDWLLFLYKNEEGGILADEMGLGKTLQILSFLSAMFQSKFIKNVLILSPATVMKHWVCEWKSIFPFERICIFHKSKSPSVEKLINSFKFFGGIGVVSYDGFKIYFKNLKKIKWDYTILDEGHKIKNMNSLIFKYVKEFECENKIMITGTPIQNNLGELWTLFDFIVPGKLGSYSSFMEEYEIPIKEGGYMNANQNQIQKAYKCSVILRNLIEPNILRRLKSKVAGQLPNKTDKVIFCSLTEEQIFFYKKCLDSDLVEGIFKGEINVLTGIDSLRKICNHLFLHTQNDKYLNPEYLVNFCGKMIILDNFLKKWKKEENKVLIFSQTIGMLNIIEKYLKYSNFNYLRMDGKTSISKRNENIEKFNNEKNIFVFLLTTRVGGLGLNLVGANRVIIYDPDWNPSTDNQAKERAYRYGQSQDVETYRLICANTIEEKVYQKQIFKNLLSKKILKNPNISKFFAKSNLIDIFTYEHNTTQIGKITSPENENVQESNFIDLHDYEFKNIIELTSEEKKIISNYKLKNILTDTEMIDFINLRERDIKED